MDIKEIKDKEDEESKNDEVLSADEDTTLDLEIKKEDESPAVSEVGEEKAEDKKEDTVKNSMESLIESTVARPEKGDLIEGPVVSIDKSAVYIDLPPFGTGIIYGRELMGARDVIKKIAIGDKIAAKVVEAENHDGYVELSLKEARQAVVWEEAEVIMKEKTSLELSIKEANKGGLIVEWQGIQGFLPVSQLKSEHYPRVEEGNKERILEELKKLIGKKMTMSIISALPKEGKLIFSEKDSNNKEREEIVSKYKVGDIVEGEITGIVEFGIFLKVEDILEGLVHISEMDWGLVEDPKSLFKIGDKVKAQVIEVKNGKISLSIKALKENPWKEAEEKYKKGDIVEGVVIKFNKHGALVSIEEGVAGLAHVSEFGAEVEMKDKMSLGSTYPFQITLFEPKNQKMILAYMDKDKIKKEVESPATSGEE